MPLLPRLSSLCRNLFQKDRAEDELAEEVHAYLEMLIETKIMEGLNPQEARRQALIDMGGLEQVKENVREVRMGHHLETIWQDLRYSIRMLRRKPGFTAVAVLVLALGIGVNSTIFSAVNTVLIQPLPFKDPDRLMRVWETFTRYKGSQNTVTPANFFDWRTQNQTFEDMASFNETPVNLTGAGEPEKLEALTSTDSLFDILGVQPLLGRTFFTGEVKTDQMTIAVMSYGLWQRRFGGDPNIVGDTITLDGQKVTVAGIMPPSFQFPSPSIDLWVPLAMSPQVAKARNAAHYLEVIGRLKPGVSYQQAQADLGTIAAQLGEQYPKTNELIGALANPLHEQQVGDVRPALLILLGAAGFVLMIACANVANLLLARAAVRQKEIAVRAALGAGRVRLIRQFLTESVLLAGLGGLAGLLLAFWGIDLLVALMPDTISQVREIKIDRAVLAFTVSVSVLTGLIFGLVPALQSSRPNLNEALKEGGRNTTAGGSNRVRSMLVITEVALSVMLLIGAGLLINSFFRLSNVDPGFNTDNMLTMDVTPALTKYSDLGQRAAFYDRVLEQIEALPGIESAAFTTSLPIKGDLATMTFITEQQGEPKTLTAAPRTISSSYFRTMGMSLVRGRNFNSGDTPVSRGVVIINEAMARQCWPDEDPVGKRVKIGVETNPWVTVAGVVSDTKLTLLQPRPFPQVYAPYSQYAFFYPRDLVVRAQSNPLSLVSAVREAVWAIDKDQPVANVVTMRQLLSDSIARQRFNMVLLFVFAAVALVLAVVGLYGVMSYSVTQHTREIGIRMALGAQASDILRLVLGRGLVLTVVGVAVGLAGAFALTRLMASLLFGVTAADPMTFACVAVLLMCVAMLACYLPAHRAMKVDPTVALRYE